jgi:hypothetical protein
MRALNVADFVGGAAVGHGTVALLVDMHSAAAIVLTAGIAVSVMSIVGKAAVRSALREAVGR